MMLIRHEIEAIAYALDHLHEAVALPVRAMAPMLSARQKLAAMAATATVPSPVPSVPPLAEPSLAVDGNATPTAATPDRASIEAFAFALDHLHEAAPVPLPLMPAVLRARQALAIMLRIVPSPSAVVESPPPPPPGEA
jgi:hypothetical protein